MIDILDQENNSTSDSIVKNHWFIEYEADDASGKVYGEKIDSYHVVKYMDVHLSIKVVLFPFTLISLFYSLKFVFKFFNKCVTELVLRNCCDSSNGFERDTGSLSGVKIFESFLEIKER